MGLALTCKVECLPIPSQIGMCVGWGKRKVEVDPQPSRAFISGAVRWGGRYRSADRCANFFIVIEDRRCQHGCKGGSLIPETYCPMSFVCFFVYSGLGPRLNTTSASTTWNPPGSGKVISPDFLYHMMATTRTENWCACR